MVHGMTLLPLAEWMPDQPDLVGQASSVVKNCVPRTKASYGPMGSFSTVGAALTARCQGAIAVEDTGGNVYSFAGDATKLYELTGSATSWTDVKKLGGYTTGTTERWSFTYFSGRVIAANYTDAIQSFVLGSSSVFADLAAAAPKARYVTSLSKGFVAAANTFDGVSSAAPQRVWWCAFGDPTSWPTPGSSAALAVQSDYQDLQGDHGECQGIVGNLGMADAAVFFERAVYRMVYVGGSAFFQFSPAENVRGTPAPGSICQLGNTVFFLGEDGFYMFDGSSSVPIGAGKVDKFFLNDVDEQYFDRISSAVDPQAKLIFWTYAGAGNSAGVPNRMLCYNWDVQRWTYIDSLSIEFLYRTMAGGYTLDQLDAVFGSNMDAFTFSLDSILLAGGQSQLGGFDTSHRVGSFTGTSIAATVDSAEGQLAAPRRAFVRGVRPITDASTPSVSIGARDRTQDAVTWGPSVAMDALGGCPQRSNARFHRARISMPAAGSWSHVSALDVDAAKEGAR
jgi:hypothetical protein